MYLAKKACLAGEEGTLGARLGRFLNPMPDFALVSEGNAQWALPLDGPLYFPEVAALRVCDP